jgi:hypothetical protein
MRNQIKAIQQLAPNLDFRLENDDLNTLESLNGKDLPSIEDIKAKMLTIESEEINQIQIKAKAKAALLERLGITADEAALLLG